MTWTDWAIVLNCLVTAMILDIREYVKSYIEAKGDLTFDFRAALPRWILGALTGFSLVLASYAGN